MRTQEQSWLRRLGGARNASLGLVCFPYAGGGVGAYARWTRELPPEVETWFVDLPGRGGRILESPAVEFSEIVRRAGRAICESVVHDFAFFGHSLGALLAFETARHLRANGAKLPCHLFVSAAEAPQLTREETDISHLPDDEFLRELDERYGGIPKEVASEPEVLALLLPGLRADVKLMEQYRYLDEAPLSCPVTAFGGLEDAMVSREAVEAWRQQTTGGFRHAILAGDHFLLQTARARLAEEVRAELMAIL